jgi:outer membrane protein TolC
MSWRLFDTGRTRSNIAQQEAVQEQSLIAHHQAVLAALQEVENALIASTKEEEHRKAIEAAVAANRKAVELSMELYTEGLTDFLNVLQAQRALYLSEEAFALSTRTLSTLLSSLYTALGGGWEWETEEERDS